MAGTKNRIKQAAIDCRGYIKAKYPTLALQYIKDVEDALPYQERDEAWQQFCDQRQMTREMLQRVEAHYTKWAAGE